MVDMELMAEIASGEVLAEAYKWLCERRKDYHHNADVWDVRWRWADLKTQLQERLLAGTYRLGTVDRVETSEDTLELWAALDALVLKAAAIVLSGRLGTVFSRSCYHPAGHGEAKKAVRDVAEHVGENTFVFRFQNAPFGAGPAPDLPRGLSLSVWDFGRRYASGGSTC